MNQNEKLAMFGVTHVADIDGFSRKIVEFITDCQKFKGYLQASLWVQVAIILALTLTINYRHVQTHCERGEQLVREIVVNRIVILNNFQSAVFRQLIHHCLFKERSC